MPQKDIQWYIIKEEPGYTVLCVVGFFFKKLCISAFVWLRMEEYTHKRR